MLAKSACDDSATHEGEPVKDIKNGFHAALEYLQQVPNVVGGVVVAGERIGVAGAVEIAA